MSQHPLVMRLAQFVPGARPDVRRGGAELECTEIEALTVILLGDIGK